MNSKVIISIKNKLLIVGLFLFSISILLPLNLRNIPIFILAVVALLGIVKKENATKSQNKTLFINLLFFTIMLLSLISSENISYGQKRIMGFLPMLVTPLAFYSVKESSIFSNEKIILNFYKCYFASIVLFFVIIIAHNYLNGFLNNSIFIHFSERLNSTYGKYSLHPIYASIHVVVALFFSKEIYKSLNHRYEKILILAAAALLIIILFMLSRKGPIFSFSLIAVFYLIVSQRSLKQSALFLAITSVFVLSTLAINPIKDRYVEFFNFVTNNDEDRIGSTSFRSNVYDCTIEKIGERPILGYGIGDTRQALKDCYNSKNNIYSGLYFNSHNQFFSAWLSAGIIGLLSLLTLFIWNFKLALQNRDFISLSILSFFFCMLCLENMLERQNGVILISFFINFFAFKNIIAKKTIS